MKKYIFFLIPLLYLNNVYCQVLYDEDFDNLTIGNITTDPTGATPGQGNWYVRLMGITEAKIVQEPNRGKVLAVVKPTNDVSNFRGQQKNLQTVWNNRAAGNNILLAEYDFYAEDIGGHGQSSRFILRTADNNQLIDMILQTKYNSTLQVNETSLIADFAYAQQGNYVEYNNFNYSQSWFTVKVYINYNTDKTYLHIPALGILHSASYGYTIDILDEISFAGGGGTNSTYIGVVHKYDNVRLTAIKTLPQELLSTENFLSEKFNLYPNPATDIVNITNSENYLVNQVVIYDVTGKQLSTQIFNNEAEIQLNVEDLASGVYLLHIQTNEGTAVKKLVKK